MTYKLSNQGFQKSFPATNCGKVEQRDINFSRVAYRIGNVFFMTPWYSFQKQVLVHPVLNKILASVYGLCLGAFLLTALFLREKHEYTNRFDRILSLLSGLVSIFLIMFLIFGGMILQQHTYEKYVRKLTTTRYFIRANSQIEVTTFFYIQFIIGHLVFIPIVLYNWYVDADRFGNGYVNLSAISSAVSEYYCFLPALHAGNQALLLKCRYQVLNDLVMKQIQNPLQTPEKQMVFNILNIGRQYRAVAEVVDLYNDIFGWVIVFVFWHSIIEFLRFPNLFLILKQDPELFWMMFGSALLSSLLSMGESIYLIWSCDCASSAGSKMVKLCGRLQENVATDSKARTELFRLAEIAKTYAPKFTAANLFVIKKGTVLSLISIATTYIIVIVQFNGALKD